ncbi:MAG TPA: LON peptidase substrate-binding domain-containing protein [Longimicrobiaceae bacterium]|nr:LON peptidase substrate-binding domain-containing protein [Longimicrobiaceae bacterium]
MRRLPLFPLPIVLFPGALMPLHVFEPRYRQMMARCLEGDRCFGLIYHDPDRFGPFEMEPGRVGCVAEILKFQPLPDGRSLVLTEGTERFRIEDGIETDELYYEALVEEYPDLDEGRRGIVQRRRRSIELFQRVLTEALKHPGPLPPIDPGEETAFQLAQAIRIDPAWQQELLETRGERARLDRLDFLLRAVLEGAE